MKLRTNTKSNVVYGMSIVCLAIFWIFCYMLMSYVISLIGLDNQITNLICNVIALIGLLVWARQDSRVNPSLPEKQSLKMSAFGWVMVLGVFALLFSSVEILGNFIYTLFPTFGVSADYANMSDLSVYIYTIGAVTVGPVMEELFFRRFVFAKLRGRFSFLVSTTISTLLFIAFHGTLMHIPLAVGLSLVTCMFYDMTGQIGWSMFFHVLFNYLAASFIIVVPMPVWVASIVYAVTLSLFILAYVYRKQVFGKYLKAGSLAQFEAFLDEKRKHLETLGQTNTGAESEQKAE